MSEEKTEKKMSETETQDRIASEDEILEETNPETNSENDDEDLLYTHKPENRGSSMQWNSAFCRRPGH